MRGKRLLKDRAACLVLHVTGVCLLGHPDQPRCVEFTERCCNRRGHPVALLPLEGDCDQLGTEVFAFFHGLPRPKRNRALSCAALAADGG